ncbi:ParA family protein [bacterium AH-315-E09]|nr:ParA family protein [Alkaliphilus sp. AH-315-G20]MBN4074401.1 ParA family protein [bacterium AH-315-E09]
MNFAYMSNRYKENVQELESLNFSVVIKDTLDFREITESYKLKIEKLIIDLGAVEDDVVFLNSIKKLRMTQEQAQIIVLATDRKEEKDILLAKLVRLGIYDIVLPTKKEANGVAKYIININSITTMKNTYLNASRYDFDFETRKEIKTITKVEKDYTVESLFKEVITVWSLSQGSSTVASHLAYALASRSNCKVCLVDFNPLKPSFKKLFKMDFDFGLLNVLDSLERDILDNDKLLSFITPHKKQRNLDLLPGVYDLNDYYIYASNRAYLKHLDEVIEKLKFLYDYVVIDTHAYHDIQTTNQALRKADKVIVPFCANNYDIEEINRYTSMFKKYNDFNTSKFSFVVNKYSGKDLTSFETESMLDGDIVGYLSDRKEYEKNNSFTSSKIINEHVDILKKIKVGVNLKKKYNLFGRKNGGEVS